MPSVEFKRLVVTWNLPGDDVRQTHWDFRTEAADPEGAVEAAHDAFWTGFDDLVGQPIVLNSYKWYGRDVPNMDPPLLPFRITDRSVTASPVSGALPPQLAVAVTKVIEGPYYWKNGRAYLPISSAIVLASNGRLANGYADSICAATQTFLNACVAADMQPVVLGKLGLRLAAILGGSATSSTYFDVEKVRVDNVFDTIRSRGWDSFTYEKILSIDHI